MDPKTEQILHDLERVLQSPFGSRVRALQYSLQRFPVLDRPLLCLVSPLLLPRLDALFLKLHDDIFDSIMVPGTKLALATFSANDTRDCTPRVSQCPHPAVMGALSHIFNLRLRPGGGEFGGAAASSAQATSLAQGLYSIPLSLLAV